MFPFNGMVRGLAQRTRDRLTRRLWSAIADTQAELDEARSLIATLRQEVRALREQTVHGERANRVLADVGMLMNLTPEQRQGDGTLQGALGTPTWEGSVAAYRPAFQVAIDYLRSVQVYGPAVEFGTCTGFTARLICELLVGRSFDVDLYLYDSFEGLPEVANTPDAVSYEVKDHRVWYRGSMAMPPGYEEEIRKILTRIRPPQKLHIVKGYYDQTLDAGLPKEKCSLIHIDCDIYTSAKYVLDKLAEKDLFQDGCVVLFDDFNCNRANPNMGERRALAEFLRENPRWTCSPWFAYGWHAQAFFFHDQERSA